LGLYGIISVLDGTHSRLVRDLWAEIDRTCGPRSLVPHPLPHFTYQVAEDYDLAQLNDLVGTLATHSIPFYVRSTGLGIFNRFAVVYVAVARTPDLDRYHAALWPQATRAARVPPHSVYAPEHWVPHITLAQGPQIQERIPDIVRLLYRRDLAWQIEVNNLTVVYEDETHKELICRHDFPGSTDPPPPMDQEAPG
jgi:2'-5' RNA ligase